MKKLLALVCCAALMSACGGGGGGGGTSGSSGSNSGSGGTGDRAGNGQNPGGNSPAAGLWLGQSDSNQILSGIVLGDGSYYVIYSAGNTLLPVAGFVQGKGSASNGNFTSSSARDFNVRGLGILDATLSASYRSKSTFNGSLSYGNNVVSGFTTSYSNGYEVAPSLSKLASSYTGNANYVTTGSTTPTVLGITLNIAADGTLSTSGSACSLQGKATPHSGANAYDLTLTFGGGNGCALNGLSHTGVAFLDSNSPRLYLASTAADRNSGLLFVSL